MPRKAKKARVATQAVETEEGSEEVIDRICLTLTSAIAEGALRAGAKIRDEVLAEHFGVSRTVVRGALDILQRDHLVDRKRNHGFFVSEPTIEEAKQLFEARHVLEQTVLVLIVERVTEKELDYLDEFNEQDQRIRHGLDTRPKGPVKKFHVELARMGHNVVLTEMVDKMMARIGLVMSFYDPETHDPCGDHRKIIAALRRRDLAAAKDLMAEHLGIIERRVRLLPTEGDQQTFVNLLKAFS
jgi:DNA-binding GntR family transcriptional regulator